MSWPVRRLCGSLGGRSRAGCWSAGWSLGPPGHVCVFDAVVPSYTITFFEGKRDSSRR